MDRESLTAPVFTIASFNSIEKRQGIALPFSYRDGIFKWYYKEQSPFRQRSVLMGQNSRLGEIRMSSVRRRHQ